MCSSDLFPSHDNLLGYGSLIGSSNTGKAAITKKYLGVDTLGDADNPLVYQTSQTVNALPFLAYQKIYYDFYINSQWEKHKAYAYNVDYWSGTGSIGLVTDMVQLRYANYPKDYFMGMLPSSQYGSVAALSPIVHTESSNIILARSSSAVASNSVVRNPNGTSTVETSSPNTTGGPDGTSAPTFPTIETPSSTGYVAGSLADYLGVPIGVPNKQVSAY